jgi:hypothetical protein
VMDATLLTGRTARCGCGAERPSAGDGRGSLAFFEYLGPGSRPAEIVCRHCRYHDVAHDPDHMATLAPDRNGLRRPTVVESGKCPGFEPHGPFDHDRFYCGCRGWD